MAAMRHVVLVVLIAAVLFAALARAAALPERAGVSGAGTAERPGILPHPPTKGGQIKVYNLSDKTVSIRTNIAGVLYSTLALERGVTGYLDCEYVWYEVEFFEANTNRPICRTGTPVNVYCGNTVVLEGTPDGQYVC